MSGRTHAQCWQQLAVGHWAISCRCGWEGHPLGYATQAEAREVYWAHRITVSQQEWHAARVAAEAARPTPAPTFAPAPPVEGDPFAGLV